MIKQETIEKVLNEAQIEEVIGDFVDLKKSGKDWKGKSPWTTDKTPSFMVSRAKQIFKDFSSGKGGNVISFLMEQNMTFPEAVEYIANKYSITVEVDESKEVSQETKDKRKEQLDTAEWCAEQYQKYLADVALKHDDNWVNAELVGRRGFTHDSILQWRIGFAPNEDDFDWKFVTARLIENGKYEPAFDLGLIKTSDNQRNYDG